MIDTGPDITVILVSGGLHDGPPSQSEIDAAVARARAAGERVVIVGGLPKNEWPE